MKKHRLNIVPNSNKHDYELLTNDILKYGYNHKYPITLYEGDVLDGWQRYRICQDHKIIPVYENFEGNDIEALQFVLQASKRRNLTSAQWAAVANEATDIINSLERQAKERMISNLKQNKNTDSTKKVPSEKGKVADQITKIFPTSKNNYYAVKRIKREQPDEFEKIKSGEKTISQVRKESTPVIQKDESNPFFYQTSKLLGQAFDHLERILQKEYIPKTTKDFTHIDSINHELYRLVRLAGQAGIDIKSVWEKMAGRHGEVIKIPEHLKRPSNLED